MNRRRNKSSNRQEEPKQKRVIRCRSKMVPVFESDNCENFINKIDKEPNQICRNCKNSF